MPETASACGATASSKVTQLHCRLPLAALSCETSGFLPRRPDVDLRYAVSLPFPRASGSTGFLSRAAELGPSTMRCQYAGRLAMSSLRGEIEGQPNPPITRGREPLRPHCDSRPVSPSQNGDSGGHPPSPKARRPESQPAPALSKQRTHAGMTTGFLFTMLTPSRKLPPAPSQHAPEGTCGTGTLEKSPLG